MTIDSDTPQTARERILTRLAEPGFTVFAVTAMLLLVAAVSVILLPLRETLGVLNLTPLYLLLALALGLLFSPKVATL